MEEFKPQKQERGNESSLMSKHEKFMKSMKVFSETIAVGATVGVTSYIAREILNLDNIEDVHIMGVTATTMVMSILSNLKNKK